MNDCVVASPLGIHALIYPVIAVSVSNIEERFIDERRLIRALGIAVGVATGVILTAAVGNIFGEQIFNTSSLPETALIAGVITTIFSKPVSSVVHWTVSSGTSKEVKTHFSGRVR